MEEFKMCSDGEFMPVSLPCPPPYSGPYYYYPYENIPDPPAAGGNNDDSNNNYTSSNGGAAPISAGAVAGIIVLIGFIITMLCLFGIKFRSRLFRSSILSHGGTNSRDQDGVALDLAGMNSGDVLLDVSGGAGGLEEKLVNLLPVFEYVKLQDFDGGKKILLDVQQKEQGSSSSCECAVCLSSFEEREIVRILPKCKHVFHILCIDKWFESHANCPLCRERITLQTIQHFFKTSEDHITLNNIDADHHHDGHPQADVGHEDVGVGANIIDHDDYPAVDDRVETGTTENCNAQHHIIAAPACVHEQSLITHKQQEYAGATHDHGSTDSGRHGSYTKPYVEASTDHVAVNNMQEEAGAGIAINVVREKKVNYLTCLGTGRAQERIFYQSFSFPARKQHDADSAQINDDRLKEMRESPQFFTYSGNTISIKSSGDADDQIHSDMSSPNILALACMSTPRHIIINSSAPFHHNNSNLKRSVSAGSSLPPKDIIIGRTHIHTSFRSQQFL